MSALINSRYRIIKTLGENAQGSIFLVEDTLYDNSLAALKTIHAGDMDDVLLNNLRAEFYTLGRFKHPSIAQVYDVGRIRSTDLEGYAGSLFFTLEYVEGTDLFRYTETADWDTIVSLVFQIAHALEYIHRHGLIHFDIKPANIIVTDAGLGSGPVVKIIDFGFASPRLASLGKPIRGTLEYMAPELLRGEPYDHRVDLYSLGVTLYEIIARQTPFHGGIATETIRQHLSSPVPVPGSARAGVPRFLDELVAALLHKDPAGRLASAAAIVGFLHARHPGEFPLQHVLEHVPMHRLIGRNEEARRLNRDLLDYLAGPAEERPRMPSVTFVTGESGIGKTALLQEVELQAQTDGLLFFDTQCFVRNAQPYEPFLKLLRDQIAYVRSFGPEGEHLLRRHSEFLSRVYGSDPDAQTIRPALQVDDPERRLHFVDLWSQLFFDITSLAPFAVWIDNIDDADESTLELVAHIVRSTPRHRLKFFISGISGPTIARLTQTLDAASAETLLLAPLHDDAVAELMSMSLNVGDMPAPLAKLLAARLGGSPSILLEFLSQYSGLPYAERAAAVERGLLSPDGNGTFADALLEGYRQKVSQRKPEELFLLRVLSCFDAPVSLRLLQQISPFTPLRVKYFHDLLVNVGIVRCMENGIRCFISQSRFRDFIYASLGDEKHMLHLLIADTMANDAGTRADHAETIAHHYKDAGSGRNAYPFFVAAAEQRRSHYALHECLSLLNEACSCIPSEEVDIAVFENLADCYSLTGDYQNAVLLYGQLRTDDCEESKRYKYAKELGLIYSREGSLDDAYGLLLEASSLARTPEEIIDVDVELSIIDISRGKYNEAFERCTRVLKTHVAEDNSASITGILNNLGILHFYRNEFEDAAACFRRSIAILQYDHQKPKLISPYLNLGNVCSAQEQYAEAARHWQHALALSHEVGNLQQEARAYNNIGIASFNQGSNDEAAAHYEKAYEIFSRLGSLPGMALCLTNIGEVHLANAKYESAITCWEKDLSLYETLRDEHGMTEVDLLLAGARMVFGQWEAAAALLDSAEGLLSGSSNTSQQALYRYTRGVHYEHTGRHADAQRHLEAAREMYAGANDHRGACLASLALAETERALGDHRRSADVLSGVIDLAAERNYTLLHCEALVQLGVLSDGGRVEGLQPAIMYLTGAFDLVQTQNVTETTWKVCSRLGKEYIRRGMHEKGIIRFRFAMQTIEYIASEVASDALRAAYLASHGRGELLKEMRSAMTAAAEE